MTVCVSKVLLLILSFGTFVGFLVHFIAAAQLARGLHEAALRGWAVDASVYYPGGYHLIVLPFIAAIIFARKFYVALALSAIYLGLHFFALYLFTQTCFLGGDICPPAPIWTKLVNRLTYFDWSATIIIPILFALTTFSAVFFAKTRRLS